MKSKKFSDLPPKIIEAITGALGEEMADPLIQLLRSFYNDGVAGINKEDHLRDFEVASEQWCEFKGKQHMTHEEIKLLGLLLKWERLCWEQGRLDATKGAVKL